MIGFVLKALEQHRHVPVHYFIIHFVLPFRSSLSRLRQMFSIRLLSNPSGDSSLSLFGGYMVFSLANLDIRHYSAVPRFDSSYAKHLYNRHQ